MIMKISKLILVFVFSVIVAGIFAQENYKIDIQFQSKMPAEQLYLIGYYGHDLLVMDSCVTDDNSRCVFFLDENVYPGMYRIENASKSGVDVLYNYEDIEISINRYFWLDSLEVKKSEETKIFIEYLRNKASFEQRLELLQPLVIYYPKGDTFYPMIETKVKVLEDKYSAYLNGIFEDHENSVVAKIVRIDQLPDIDPAALYPELTDFYREHYFDSVDLEDTIIINTPVLPAKLINYLSLYVSQGASREKQEEDFIKAVDALMEFTSGSEEVQEMVINYLIDGFQAYGFEKVMTHLVENYLVNNSCVSDQKQSELLKRVDGFKTMAIGKKASNIELPDEKGNPISLIETSKDYKVILFWASWCPHCSSMIPELKSLKKKYNKEVDFIAVSVDSDQEEWKKAINENKFDWMNLSDLNGWDNKAAIDYNVYATPTFFVLDKDLKIVGKPVSGIELEEILKNKTQ